MEYRLTHIAAATGLKPRTVQVWAEAGAIRADRSTDREGTGVHRRFSLEEAMIACALAPLQKLQMSIGALIQVAGNIRSNMGILLPKFLDAMNNSVPHVLTIHFFDVEEDEGGIMCSIRSPYEPPEAPPGPGEVNLKIFLPSALAGLRRLK